MFKPIFIFAAIAVVACCIFCNHAATAGTNQRGVVLVEAQKGILDNRILQLIPDKNKVEVTTDGGRYTFKKRGEYWVTTVESFN